MGGAPCAAQNLGDQIGTKWGPNADQMGARNESAHAAEAASDDGEAQAQDGSPCMNRCCLGWDQPGLVVQRCSREICSRMAGHEFPSPNRATVLCPAQPSHPCGLQAMTQHLSLRMRLPPLFYAFLSVPKIWARAWSHPQIR